MKSAIIIAIIAISALLYTPLIAAAECTFGLFCGRVENKTPYHMKWADLEKKNGKCKVWNADGSIQMNTKIVDCEQKDVDGAVGGRTHDGIDVDAFCFPNNGYWVKFGGQVEHYIGAGEWVRIRSTETARCTNDNTVIHCKV